MVVGRGPGAEGMSGGQPTLCDSRRDVVGDPGRGAVRGVDPAPSTGGARHTRRAYTGGRHLSEEETRHTGESVIYVLALAPSLQLHFNTEFYLEAFTLVEVKMLKKKTRIQ